MDTTRSVEWEYTVQLSLSAMGQYLWKLTRTSRRPDSADFHEAVVISPEVFENEDDAKRDALKKLSILRCPLERPLDRTPSGGC